MKMPKIAKHPKLWGRRGLQEWTFDDFPLSPTYIYLYIYIYTYIYIYIYILVLSPFRKIRNCTEIIMISL